jgi:hypothetical protein
MLFFPVYIEPHPRRDAGLAACCTSSIFSNPFRSYSFRTLASHLKATVSSNSFSIKRFRTLCKIPGIGYPLSPLVSRHSPLFIHPLYFQSFPDSCCTMERRNPCIFRRFQSLSIAMGVYTPLPHLHQEPIPFSSIRKSVERRRVSTRLERLMPFTSHESPITSHGPCALCPSTGSQHPTVPGKLQLGYPMPLPIYSIAGRASTWEG